MSGHDDFDVAVVGAGPAGLACAIALARYSVKTVLFSAPHHPNGAKEDLRTAALFGCSIDFLENLGVMEHCRQNASPIIGIRIIDDTDRILKAPELSFRASDVDRETFGYNIRQTDLVAALRALLPAYRDVLHVIETASVSTLEITDDDVQLETEEGQTVNVKAVAAADGRNSICRNAAGIETNIEDYGQRAVVTTFTHTRDHEACSTEFHRRGGPLTVVPMNHNRSSLVWVEKEAVAQRLLRMDDERFIKTLEPRLHGLLGNISDLGPRAAFPLSRRQSKAMCRNRVYLVGEAGHVIPPIGAQGLNLSFRDGACLADVISDAIKDGRDPGSQATLDAYEKARWFDVSSRGRGIDFMNRLLTTRFIPLHLAHGLGAQALKAIGPLRRLAIEQGLGPTSDLPRMMRTPEHGRGPA